MTTDSITQSKRCSRCGQDFPATPDYFHRHKTSRGGLHNVCHECRNKERHDYNIVHADQRREHDHQYYEAHKKQISDRGRAYRATHQEQTREQCRQYHADHRERENARSREWHITHREYARAKGREWRDSHQEQAREIGREWRSTHQEHIQAKGREYYKAHQEQAKEYAHKQRVAYPDKKRMLNHRRLARERMLPSTFTEADWIYALDYWHGCCAYCGNPPSMFDRFTVLHADHFIPVSDPECPGTVPANMLPACQDCNLSKHTSDPVAWTNTRFGKQKAKLILKNIADYFALVHRSQSEMSGENR